MKLRLLGAAAALACALTDAYIAHNKDYCDGWH